MEIEMTIERDGNEFDVTVEMYFEKGSRGFRNKMGVPEEPDEDDVVEVESATINGSGVSIELTEAEKSEAIELAFKKIESDSFPA